MRNEVEARVVGLSRSGNHCVIDWILRQLDPPWCFLNCAEGKCDPFETARPLEDGAPMRARLPDAAAATPEQARTARKAWLIHSYEDAFFGHAFSPWFEAEHDRLVGPSRRRIDLIVLRDPLNLFASRATLEEAAPGRVAARIWKQHARAFLGRSPHLRHETAAVNFNRFIGSPAYRAALAERLGLRLRDDSLSQVARCAGGSSFDGLSFDGRAEAMPVRERWRAALHDPAWRALFDGEMAALAAGIFEDVPVSLAEADRLAGGAPDLRAAS